LPADEAARARIREALDESQLVEAAAGTGKTTVLVERLVAILEQGRGTVDGLAAVTFTRKAAGELKLRLRQALDARLLELRGTGAAVDRQERLENAISRLEQAAIGTIHSLCADILRGSGSRSGVRRTGGGRGASPVHPQLPALDRGAARGDAAGTATGTGASCGRTMVAQSVGARPAARGRVAPRRLA
ncbi:MAG: UvrD-helicase domain-containing protein, partial [Acidobacteria bacterium]|nr:UvrD-helicase domain-containing protein [Acidobacteriota bacterium]